MKQKYQNSRQSSRPETVRLQGRASPSLSSQLFSRIASLGLGPACSRARFLGVARPPSPNAAILESVNLGKMEKYRGCFLETARFYFFFFFWSAGDIYLPSICFFVPRSVFCLSSRASVYLSSLRYCGLALVGRFVAITSPGGSPLGSLHPLRLASSGHEYSGTTGARTNSNRCTVS